MSIAPVFIRKFLPFAFAVLAFSPCLQAFGLEQDLLAIQNAMQEGDLNRAARLIQASLAAHPHAGGVLNLRGIIHAQKNELAEARADFEAAVRLSPDLTPAWQNLARACQLQLLARPAAAPCAIRSWQRVLHLNPSDTEAHRSLAALYQQQGKFSESLHELEALPTAQAQATPNLLLKCADYALLHKTAEAAALASQLAARSDLSDEDWRTVGHAFETPASAPLVITLVESMRARQAAGIASLRSLAIAFEQAGRPQDARQTLERIALLDPKNTAHLLELARLAEAAKDYEGALGYLAHARVLAPKNAQIHFLFAMVAEEMSLPIVARASLNQALALDPDNPAYNYALGFVILGTRDAATAGSYFQKFVNAKPGNAKGHYALGIAFYASGDFTKSKAQMQLVQNNPATAGGAEYFLGRIARQDDDLAAASQHLERSVKLLPDFSESHTELARIDMLQKNFAAARTELNQALHIDPKSFPANEQLLVLYKRTHDPAAEAQEQLVKKLDTDRSKRTELMLRTVEARP